MQRVSARISPELNTKALEAIGNGRAASMSALIGQALDRYLSSNELEDAYRDAVASAHWLDDSDLAAVEIVAGMVRELGVQIAASRSDTLLGAGSDSKLIWKAEPIVRGLSELGLTPAGRERLSIESEPGDADVVANIIGLVGS